MASLRDAKTTKEVCALKRDNKCYGDYSILSDGYRVTLSNQPMGREPLESITIPRSTFNRMIDFYQKDQK